MTINLTFQRHATPSITWALDSL